MVPKGEIAFRIGRLRAELKRQKSGGILLSGRDDVYYFSGFTGDDSMLLVTLRESILITDFRYIEEAQKSAPSCAVEIWKKNPYSHTGELVKSKKIKKILFQAGDLAVSAYEGLKKGARGVRLEPEKAICATLRAVKSTWEIRKIKAALRCAEKAFEAVKTRIKAGMTETDLRLDLEWEMRRRGAQDVAFESIIACRANSSLPHAHAGKRKITPASPLLIDFGARVDRYNSDLTRVLFLDTIPRVWQKRYLLVLEAQRLGMKNVCPGRPGAEADAAARDYFGSQKCTEKFGHSLGHGVGLAVHESPRLSTSAKEPLEPGMVVTVEPGLYYPRQGGIRIEDMVLVTKTGPVCLSKLEKSLNWAVI